MTMKNDSNIAIIVSEEDVKRIGFNSRLHIFSYIKTLCYVSGNNSCFLSLTDLAERLSVARPHVSRDLTWLIDQGYITKETKPLKNGFSTNFYSIPKQYQIGTAPSTNLVLPSYQIGTTFFGKSTPKESSPLITPFIEVYPEERRIQIKDTDTVPRFSPNGANEGGCGSPSLSSPTETDTETNDDDFVSECFEQVYAAFPPQRRCGRATGLKLFKKYTKNLHKNLPHILWLIEERKKESLEHSKGVSNYCSLLKLDKFLANENLEADEDTKDYQPSEPTKPLTEAELDSLSTDLGL